jgi:hypothetical protein
MARLILLDGIALNVDGLPDQPRVACPSPARSFRFAPVWGQAALSAQKGMVHRNIDHSTKPMNGRQP